MLNSITKIINLNLIFDSGNQQFQLFGGLFTSDVRGPDNHISLAASGWNAKTDAVALLYEFGSIAVTDNSRHNVALAGDVCASDNSCSVFVRF